MTIVSLLLTLKRVAKLELRNYIFIEGVSSANPLRYLGYIAGRASQVGIGKGFEPLLPSAK